MLRSPLPMFPKPATVFTRILSLVLPAFLLSLPFEISADAFVRFGSISGGATESAHLNWSEFDSSSLFLYRINSVGAYIFVTKSNLMNILLVGFFFANIFSRQNNCSSARISLDSFYKKYLFLPDFLLGLINNPNNQDCSR